MPEGFVFFKMRLFLPKILTNEDKGTFCLSRKYLPVSRR